MVATQISACSVSTVLALLVIHPATNWSMLVHYHLIAVYIVADAQYIVKCKNSKKNWSSVFFNGIGGFVVKLFVFKVTHVLCPKNCNS